MTYHSTHVCRPSLRSQLKKDQLWSASIVAACAAIALSLCINAKMKIPSCTRLEGLHITTNHTDIAVYSVMCSTLIYALGQELRPSQPSMVLNVSLYAIYCPLSDLYSLVDT